MPNYLARAQIFGLWDDNRTVDITFDTNFNFIIGKNGTGKTTVINLIAAALTADFERLDKIPFTKIILGLKPVKGRLKPSIEISKTRKPHLPYYDISYKIKSSATGETKVFDLDALEEERSYRGSPPRNLRERQVRDTFLFIKTELASIVDVSWLSVHRHNNNERLYDDRDRRIVLSSVDQKLETMKISLGRYFSGLATRFSEETLNFQKTSFLSLITIHTDGDIRDFAEKADIVSERKSLESILELLQVDQRKYHKHLDRLVAQFTDARKPLVEKKGVTLLQLSSIIQAYKSHSLVQLYEELQEIKKVIFSPRENFLLVLNGLFHPRKRISLSEENELVVRNINDTKVELEDLSSGEKQLFILLGQALLQESKPVIFIADEPELSLHVEWQELLTNAIAKLNRNAQIIFATHSPDIVGSHGEQIIEMEQFFK